VVPLLNHLAETYKECHINVTKRSLEELLNKHADLEDVFKLAFASDNKRQGVYLGRNPKGAYIFDTQKVGLMLPLPVLFLITILDVQIAAALF
jgi:hypothetical protein